MFEKHLHKDGAALLRAAVAPLYGLDAAAMSVRNLADEVPGTGRAASQERLERTRAILERLARGQRVPELLIQPQLEIQTGTDPSDVVFVAPDFMVLDPAAGIYVPGEEKSFIVREGVGEPADLDSARRQAGVQVLALRAEAERAGIGDRVANRAVFVFASPFGLEPAPAVDERHLDAEVFEVARALGARRAVASRLAELRIRGNVPLAELAGQLAFNYQESCLQSCVLATHCKRRCRSTARVLGDAAAEILGPHASLDRVAALLDGAEPASGEEAALLPLLLDAARVLEVRR